MKKRITIGLLSIFSLVVHGCSISVAPPTQNNQSSQSNRPTPIAQTELATTENASTDTTTNTTTNTTTEKTTEKTTENSAASQPASGTLSQPPLSNITGSRQDRSWENMGQASTGEEVRLTFDSIQVATRSLGLAQPPTYFFHYKIGRDYVYAVTSCNSRFSTSKDGDRFDDPRRPESAATQKMLDRVCSAWVRPAEVMSPPSHVRMGPDGEIICTLQKTQSITTYGYYKDWLYTDACGKLGLIHSSQIRQP
jgi:hypothetical protein